MDSTQRRMIAVAVVVSGFAIGMSGLLNYFKYRGTAARLVTDRLVVTGHSIETSVNAALGLGLQFGDLGTLPAILKREAATDDLIAGIDVFDSEGRMMYSTDPARGARRAPAAWLAAVRTAKDANWLVESDESNVESAAGMTLKNPFGLTLGHLALRYSNQRMRATNAAVARQMALNAAAMFLASSVLSSLALLAVMRRLNRDVTQAEAALRSGDVARLAGNHGSGPFGKAVVCFMETSREAEREIRDISTRLQTGPQA